MLRFIERNFFIVVQRIGLLFALIAFAAVIVLGMVSYEKINTRASDSINSPVIEFAKYQNPISVESASIQKEPINSQERQQGKFGQEFNQHIQTIIVNLQALPDDVINKTDMQDKIGILVKIKSSSYTPKLQLAYAASLAKLTKQVVNVGGDQVNIDDFLRWHDQEFAKQVDAQTQGNIVRMGALKSERMTGFIALGMAATALGIFIMFVMMLVMLRIEQNTRK